MAQIPPIDDAYINEIIKSNGPYNPALLTTQGLKLRELIKLLRDRMEQGDNEAVHKTGDEIISGTKTFTSIKAEGLSINNLANSSLDTVISPITGVQTKHLNITEGQFSVQLSASILSATRSQLLPDEDGLIALTSDLSLLATEEQLNSGLNSKIDINQKGIPGGISTLDSGGKILASQLPDSILGALIYQGTWNASTNTPTLIDPPGSVTKGAFYVTDASGTQFGITYAMGDWIVSNGIEWQKVDNTDAVASVFGRIGNVVANESDYEFYYPLLSEAYVNPSWLTSIPFTKITNTPTTLAGFGITDVYTKTGSDGRYPLKAGTGATGTWPIGISGNAATASSIPWTGVSGKPTISGTNTGDQTLTEGATAGNIAISGGNSVSLKSILPNVPTLFADASVVPTAGLYHYLVASGNTGYPSSLGAGIKSVRGDNSANGFFELFKPTTSEGNTVYLRSGTGGSTFSQFEKIATQEWSSTQYAPITGGNYVLKSGDTLTGNLGVGATPDPTVRLQAIGVTRLKNAGPALQLFSTNAIGNIYNSYHNNVGTRLGYVGFGSSLNNNLYVLNDNGENVYTAAKHTFNGETISNSALSAPLFGISNNSPENGRGISLQGGPVDGMATAGMSWAATSVFGTHGTVTGYATNYFTVPAVEGEPRGWIFKAMTDRVATTAGNVASISNVGTAYFNGSVTAAKGGHFGSGDAASGTQVVQIRNSASEGYTWRLSAGLNAINETDFGLYNLTLSDTVPRLRVSGVTGAATFLGNIIAPALVLRNASKDWTLVNDANNFHIQEAGVNSWLTIAKTNGNVITTGNLGVKLSPSVSLHVKGQIRSERLSGNGQYAQLDMEAGAATLSSKNPLDSTYSQIILSQGNNVSNRTALTINVDGKVVMAFGASVANTPVNPTDVTRLQDIGKMLTYTATGDNIINSFTIPHGLSYTPTMVIITPMTSFAAAGAANQPVYAEVSGANVIIHTDSDFRSGGVNNLKWTILVK